MPNIPNINEQTDAIVWRDIPGTNGYYQASFCGMIRSVDRWINRKKGPYLQKGVILKFGYNENKYPVIVIAIDGNKLSQKVHRLVALTWVENPDNHPIVRHRDDNPENTHSTNLIWGTMAMNTADAIERGRNVNPPVQFGELNVNAKLNPEKVIDIRLRKSQGVSTKELAAEYGMNSSTINDVVNRKTWVNV